MFVKFQQNFVKNSILTKKLGKKKTNKQTIAKPNCTSQKVIFNYTRYFSSIQTFFFCFFFLHFTFFKFFSIQLFPLALLLQVELPEACQK